MPKHSNRMRSKLRGIYPLPTMSNCSSGPEPAFPCSSHPAPLLIGVPTLCRADLLNQFYPDLCEALGPNERLIILDNGGNQDIRLPASPYLRIERTGCNLGVPASWNWFLREAFVVGQFEACVLLQDDIIWSDRQLASVHPLLTAFPEVNLFLSFAQFAVQVHRPENIDRIGWFDERFTPAWREDDDYALQMTMRGHLYRRFHELGPQRGSLSNATPKPIPRRVNTVIFHAKWNRDFAVNDPGQPYYSSNRDLIKRPELPPGGPLMLRLKDGVYINRIEDIDTSSDHAGMLLDSTSGRFVSLNRTAIEIVIAMTRYNDADAIRYLSNIIPIAPEYLRTCMEDVLIMLTRAGLVAAMEPITATEADTVEQPGGTSTIVPFILSAGNCSV